MRVASILLAILFLVISGTIYPAFGADMTGLNNSVEPWEDYEPSLEWEFFYPLLYYDGMLYSVVYGRMSSILRDRELQFILHADQGEEKFYYALGHTWHLNKWSYGVNLYSMPVYLGQFWESGLFEHQQGITLLGSYHWNNEYRLDLRVQWEDFVPYSSSTVLGVSPEPGRVFGTEITVGRDNHSFLAQSGAREYMSIGGAFPLFNTDYRYIKIEADRRCYYPMGDRFSFIWGLRGGRIWGDYPAQRGFMIGGVQLTNFSGLGNLANLGTLGGLADSVLRGYRLHSFPGDSFMLHNIELRGLVYPSSFYTLGDTAVILSTFLDTGQIWKNGEPLSTAPPISTGLGVKFFIFGGLIIGLDYAVPLSGPSKTPVWHFSIGEVF